MDYAFRRPRTLDDHWYPFPFMEFAVVGWPNDGATIDLDHRQFAYAGKFRIGSYGKAVAMDIDTVLAAAAFDPDRTDQTILRIRYITVRDDHRGEGIGPRLLAFISDRAHNRNFKTVAIAVNNPYAFVAAYRAGFADTGSTTGIAERVLSTAVDIDRQQYHDGLSWFLEQSRLNARERAYIDEKQSTGPPKPVDPPVY